jgi:hypothetical protein
MHGSVRFLPANINARLSCHLCVLLAGPAADSIAVQFQGICRCRRPTLSAGRARPLINGDARDQAPLKQDYGYLAGRVAELLAAVGERLIKGDRLITGSIVQVPVRAGDRVVADLGSLGAAEAHIT